MMMNHIKNPLFLLLLCCTIFSCKEDESILAPSPAFDISKSEGNIYAGMAFAVSDQSENADEITWDFGDGTVSTDSVVLHTYTAKGNYTITLTACNSGKCNEIQKTVTVKDDVLSLLAGETSKTWKLVRWNDRQGNPNQIDPCTVCMYHMTFYNNVELPNHDGEFAWPPNGQKTCADGSTYQCNSYGAEDKYGFELYFDPYTLDNGIDLWSGEIYEINVQEDELYLKSLGNENEFYYVAE